MLSGIGDRRRSVARVFLSSYGLPAGCLIQTLQSMRSDRSWRDLIPPGAIGMIIYRWPEGGRSKLTATTFYDVLLGGEIFTLDVDLFVPI